MKLATVKIEADTESGWMLINESEFDRHQHKLYVEVEVPEEVPEVGKVEPAPVVEPEKKPEKEKSVKLSRTK